MFKRWCERGINNKVYCRLSHDVVTLDVDCDVLTVFVLGFSNYLKVQLHVE